MLPTKLVLLIVAVFAVQISSGAVHSISPEETIQRLEEATESLDHELLTFKKKIQDAQHEVEELNESTVSIAKERIGDFVGPLLKNLEDLKVQGDQHGVDVRHCGEGKEDELRKIPAQNVLKLETCLNNSETPVFKEAQNAYDSLKATNDRLKELTAEIRECKNNFSFKSTRCQREVEEAVKIVFNVAKQINDADSIISSTSDHARQNIDQCTEYQGYNKKADELYREIRLCMMNNIDPCPGC